jgi:hypothetical protein
MTLRNFPNGMRCHKEKSIKKIPNFFSHFLKQQKSIQLAAMKIVTVF